MMKVYKHTEWNRHDDDIGCRAHYNNNNNNNRSINIKIINKKTNNSFLRFLLFVVLLLLQQQQKDQKQSFIPVAFAQSLYISQICPTNKHQVLQLIRVKDEYLGSNGNENGGLPVYELYKGNTDDDPTGNSFYTDANNPDANTNGDGDGDGDDDPNTSEISYFRECVCARPTGHESPLVCPLDSRFCAVPTDVLQPVQCYAEDASVMVVRNIWPLMCLWYLCFILFVCCSYKGRQAILYCLSKCFPDLNRRLVDRMLQRQRRQWTLNFWNAARNTNRNNNNNNATATATDGTNNNTNNRVLELKTKKYHREGEVLGVGVGVGAVGEESAPTTTTTTSHNHNHNNDLYEEDDFCCTICFAPLESGDRVGDLSCNHVFHVDCLKSWVLRKNSCPLCATPLATQSNKSQYHLNLRQQQQQERNSTTTTNDNTDEETNVTNSAGDDENV